MRHIWRGFLVGVECTTQIVSSSIRTRRRLFLIIHCWGQRRVLLKFPSVTTKRAFNRRSGQYYSNGCLEDRERYTGDLLALPIDLIYQGFRFIQVCSDVNCFWGTQTFVVKDDIASPDTLLRIFSVRLILAWPFATDGMNVSMIVGHYDPHLFFDSSEPWEQLEEVCPISASTLYVGQRSHDHEIRSGINSSGQVVKSRPAGSDHILALARFCLFLICGHTYKKTTSLEQLFLDDNRWPEFQPMVSTRLVSDANI